MVKSKYEMQTPGVIGGFLDKIPEYYGAYKKREELEIDAKTIEDPNASPLQRSLAISRAYGSPMGAQFMKSYEAQQQGQMANALENDLQMQLQRGQTGQPVQPTQPATPVQPGNQPSIGGLMDEFSPQQEAGMNQPQQVQPQQQPQDPTEVLRYRADTLDQAAKKATSMGLDKQAQQYKHDADQIRMDLRANQKAEATKYAADVGAAVQERKFNQTQALKIHDESKPFDQSIQDEAKSAERDLHSGEVARKAIMSGNINPRSIKGLARSLFKGSAWEAYFNNPDIARLEAASLTGYEGMRQLFGGILSDADLKIVARKVISPDKSPATNLAILDFRDFQNNMKIAEAEIGDEIKSENGGYRPIDYRAQVKNRLKERFGDQAKQIVSNAIESDMEVFNPSNKMHRERREEVLAQVGGDREAANQILSREFK